MSYGQIGCAYDEAQAIVAGFLDAYNRGDRQGLSGYFGRQFKWYSATNPGEPHFVTYGVSEALDYFERRHTLDERLTLRAFHLSGQDPTQATQRTEVNFWYELDRTFQGRTFQAMGKGAMNCEAREIFVWSMGFPSSERQR